MKMTGYILTALIAYLIGNLIGHATAHQVVATECEKLGSFYVGDTVYKCEKQHPEEKP